MIVKQVTSNTESITTHAKFYLRAEEDIIWASWNGIRLEKVQFQGDAFS